mgnify:CR=1 FL=1
MKEEPNADKTRRKLSRFNEVEETLYAIFRVKETSSCQSGGDSGRDPPVPIPNTAVKPSHADGTRGATLRESR